jgi:hypothetical protein
MILEIGEWFVSGVEYTPPTICSDSLYLLKVVIFHECLRLPEGKPIVRGWDHF